jgi:AcrR family transcriptional regulator
MSNPVPTRDRLLDAMAAHVLAHGLNDASLRPLARAAGTSDRMLIYHFGSKDGLITVLLEHLGARFATLLDQSLPPGRFATEGDALRAILKLMRSDQAAGFQRVWFDILAGSARGSLAHRTTGGLILRGLHEWLTARLPDKDRAARLLIQIEGLLIALELGADELVAQVLSDMTQG